MRYQRRSRIAIIAPALLLLGGCSGNAFLPGNDAPHIDKIMVNGVAGAFTDVDATSSTPVATNNTLTLVCQASDSNRDPLTYQWSSNGVANTLNAATGGGNTATVNVTADGEVDVACTVNDGRTGIASRSVRLKATTASNHPPTLQFTAAPATVAPGGSVALTATASDQDGDPLTYVFSIAPPSDGSAGGTITPDPTDKTKATFVAPSSAGAALLVCVVSDGKGGSAAKTARIAVAAP